MAVGKVDRHTAGVVTSWGHVIPFGMKRKMEPAAYLKRHTTAINIYKLNKYCSINVSRLQGINIT